MKSCTVNLPARPSRGFTLMELMVVVAIVGILVGIAVPTYQDSVRKSRRGQAKADLTELAQAMERYYTNNNSYLNADLNILWGPLLQSPRTGAAQYTISFDGAVTSSTFKLQAVPSTSSGQSKDKCGTLTIDNAGRKTPIEDAKKECWNMN
ncbi:type IV pilin protein [Lysobacter gummosus]|jgi:type IV pilus assembly protein PilE|uniref:Type IV pilin protein n=1 Tax=Lysobacter gummosus TaxID=262324 RepID=A0ABY3X8Y3_9GAMM|nr:type IV pilin protein [Lysobacter gummosus]UNP28065.1 type IV pilin protein [Lysobacter gummosus]